MKVDNKDDNATIYIAKQITNNIQRILNIKLIPTPVEPPRDIVPGIPTSKKGANDTNNANLNSVRKSTNLLTQQEVKFNDEENTTNDNALLAVAEHVLQPQNGMVPSPESISSSNSNNFNSFQTETLHSEKQNININPEDIILLSIFKDDDPNLLEFEKHISELEQKQISELKQKQISELKKQKSLDNGSIRDASHVKIETKTPEQNTILPNSNNNNKNHFVPIVPSDATTNNASNPFSTLKDKLKFYYYKYTKTNPKDTNDNNDNNDNNDTKTSSRHKRVFEYLLNILNTAEQRVINLSRKVVTGSNSVATNVNNHALLNVTPDTSSNNIPFSIATAAAVNPSESLTNQDDKSIAVAVANPSDQQHVSSFTPIATTSSSPIATTSSSPIATTSSASTNAAVLTNEPTKDMAIVYGDFVYKIDPETPSQFIEKWVDDNGEVRIRHLKINEDSTLQIQDESNVWKTFADDSEFYKPHPNIKEEGIIAALQLFPKTPTETKVNGGNNLTSSNKLDTNDVIKVQNDENATLIYRNIVYISIPNSKKNAQWHYEMYTPDDDESDTKTRKVRINEETNKLEFDPNQKFDSGYYNNENITEDIIMQILKY